jgi:4,5-dihydroxyphthalate decarboxylase
MFRHRSIYVNTQSKIKKPQDLIGKKIGIPRYKQTAGVWMRGIMSDEYGVPVTSPTYIQCGQEKPEVEWERFAMPAEESKSFNPEIKLQFITDKTHTLSNMLATGEVDASYSAHAPSTLYSQPKKVRLLFEDYVTEEKKYFKKTGIFPLMHVIVIKKDVYDSNPRIARSLYDAFDEAKKLTLIDMNEAAATASILPWQIHHYAEATEIMGTDYYAYGLKANRKTLETFLRYSYEQGLSRRLLKPQELFAAETLDT